MQHSRPAQPHCYRVRSKVNTQEWRWCSMSLCHRLPLVKSSWFTENTSSNPHSCAPLSSTFSLQRWLSRRLGKEGRSVNHIKESVCETPQKICGEQGGIECEAFESVCWSKTWVDAQQWARSFTDQTAETAGPQTTESLSSTCVCDTTDRWNVKSVCLHQSAGITDHPVVTTTLYRFLSSLTAELCFLWLPLIF